MKAIITRYDTKGYASREVEIEWVRSLGITDKDYGKPTIIIRQRGGNGVFFGEVEVSDKGVFCLIHQCVEGLDLLV